MNKAEVVEKTAKHLWYSSLLDRTQYILNVLFIQKLRDKIYPLGTRRLH